MKKASLSSPDNRLLVPLGVLKESATGTVSLVRNVQTARYQVARLLEVGSGAGALDRCRAFQDQLPQIGVPGVQGNLSFRETAEGPWFLADWVNGYPVDQLGDALLHERWIAVYAFHLFRALALLHRQAHPYLLRVVLPSDVVIGLTSATIVDVGLYEHIFPEALPALAADALPYAAPELRDGGEATPCSDLFSVGACVYRMLTGQAPTLARVDDEPALAELLRQRRPEMAEGHRDALLDVLRFDPAARPQTARQVAETMRRYVPNPLPMTHPFPRDVTPITSYRPAPWIATEEPAPSRYALANVELEKAVSEMVIERPAQAPSTEPVTAKRMRLQSSSAVSEIEVARPPRPPKPPRGTPSLERLHLFFARAGAMIEAGVTLHRTLELLSVQEDSPALAWALADVAERLWGGAPLSGAMAAQGRVFSPFHCAMVKQAEQTGQVGKILLNLSRQSEREMSLRRRITGALFYPTLVLVVSALMTFALFKWVLPGFLTITGGGTTPFITKVLMAGVYMVNQPLIFFPLVAGFVGAVYAVRGYLATPAGGEHLEAVLLQIPGVGRLVSNVGLVRSLRVLVAQLVAGIGLVQGLRMASETCGSPVWTQRLKRIAEGIVAGLTFSEAMRVLGVPHNSLVLQMIVGGEESGNLDDMLERAAVILEDDIQFTLEGLVQLIEPIMVTGVGCVTGFVLLGAVLPIYSRLSMGN